MACGGLNTVNKSYSQRGGLNVNKSYSQRPIRRFFRRLKKRQETGSLEVFTQRPGHSGPQALIAGPSRHGFPVKTFLADSGVCWGAGRPEGQCFVSLGGGGPNKDHGAPSTTSGSEPPETRSSEERIEWMLPCAGRVKRLAVHWS